MPLNMSAGGVLLSVLLGATFAQNVDLKGVIRDRFSSTPVAQATVTLVKLGYSAKTDSAGAFHILHIPTGRLAGGDVQGRELHRTGTGGIAFLHEGGDVEVQVTDMLGNSTVRGHRARLSAGGWEFHPGSFPNGIAVVWIKTRSSRESIKLVNLGGAASGKPGTGFRALGSRRLLAKSSAPVDSLRVTKAGINPMTLPVESLVQSGVTVQVSDTTVSMGFLSGLTLSAGTLDPPFRSDYGLYEILLRESVTSLSITPIAAPAKPWILIKDVPVAAGTASGPFPLGLFSNDMVVSVKSLDSTVKSEYYLAIHRAKDDSAGLDHLLHSAGALIPAFRKGDTVMTLEVPAGIPSVTLSPVAIQPLCAMTVDGKTVERGGASEALPIGDSPSSAVIEVLSPDSTRKAAYTVTLKRAVASKPISGFTITPGDYIDPLKPAFHPDTLFYRVTVNNPDSILDVTLYSNVIGTSLIIGVGTQTPISSGEKRSFPLRLGINRIVMGGRLPNTSGFRYHTLLCIRPKIMTTTTSVSGRNNGYAGTAYPFGFFMTRGCDVRTKAYHIFDWGDGSASTGLISLGSSSATASHAFAQPGKYAVKVRLHCKEDGVDTASISGYSDWSAPHPIEIFPTDNRPTRIVSGPYMASETWSPDTTYVVTENSLFEEATTLTILPGTRVTFSPATPFTPPNRYLLILGKLVAVGTEKDSIRFEDGLFKTPWRGPTTFNPDGSYLAGPRFEYCSFQNAQLMLADANTAFGGYGLYLKNSYVRTLGEDFTSGAAGSYIEKCRIDIVKSLRMTGSRILNSRFGTAAVSTSSSGSLRIQACEFGSLYLEGGNYAIGDVSGNTFRDLRLGSPTGAVQGNNLLATGAYAARAGSTAFNLQANFWGETTTEEMVTKGPTGNIIGIRDYLDDIQLSKIDYSNWKSTLVENALPDW